MRLSFYGATGTVTGSKYHFDDGSAATLIDCGLFQGFKQLRLRNWQPLPFDVKSLRSVLLTHAHIDHSGALPLLVKSGFAGEIYCSKATKDLCAIMLPDAAHLQEEEARYANKRGFSKHKPARKIRAGPLSSGPMARFTQRASCPEEVRRRCKIDTAHVYYDHPFHAPLDHARSNEPSSPCSRTPLLVAERFESRLTSRAPVRPPRSDRAPGCDGSCASPGRGDRPV